MSADAKNLDSQEDECDLTNKLADQSKHLQFLRKQMVQIKRQLKNQKSMRDESQLRRDQQVSIEQEEHWLELERLNDLLTIERQKFDREKMARIQLQTELEKSKSQQDKVNTVRENYMKMEEEMSIMLQRLQEQSEMLHTSTDHQMVEMKKKEEKLMQEVREAQLMMARLTEELQAEKNLNLVLQQQLETLRVSHVELSQEHETAVHQSDALKQKLEMVIRSHAEKVEKDEQLIQQLQADQEELRSALEAQICSGHPAKFELERVDETESAFLLGLSEGHHSSEKCTDESQQENTTPSLSVKEPERFSLEYQLEMVKKSHEKQTTYDQLLIKKLRTEQEVLKKTIKELMSQAEVLEEHGDQELHEQDADFETSREDSHSFMQSQQEISSQTEDALEDSIPVILHEASEAKLLPPVHRSMRRIRCFLGLRRKRQKTPTY